MMSPVLSFPKPAILACWLLFSATCFERSHHLKASGFGIVPVCHNKRARRLSLLRRTGHNGAPRIVDASRYRKSLVPLMAKEEKKGYQFGDVTKFFVKRATQRVTQLTGKETYEFGDLSKWLDAKAKSAVTDLTQQDDDYEFGDLSRWVDARVKDRVQNFTKSEDAYQFGDVTKEIGRRIASGEYTLQDMILLLKVLVTFGVGLAPVSAILPVRLLVDLLNFSIANEMGERMIGAISVELDKKMKQMVTGNAEYKLGDGSKQALLKFTGKDKYEFGDISRRIFEESNTSLVDQSTTTIKDGNTKKRKVLALGAASSETEDEGTTLDPTFLDELERWDEAVEKARISSEQTGQK
mmetsp:Transcript_18992/g.34465  ORF Transcript_18992/g.34465 Transcript_18992/m.34465 type:complete len:353 (-) Transcript_18992:292-1350(-)